MREAYLKTPSPHKEGNIKNGAKFSPEAQIEAKRKVASVHRSSRMKSSLLPWCVALSVLCVEVFTFGSNIALFFLSGCLPCSVVVICEYVLLVYLISVILWIVYQIVNTQSGHIAMPASFGMILPSPSHPTARKLDTSTLLDTSSRADTSWVEDHHFGTQSEGHQTHSRQGYTTPSRSALNDSSHLLNMSSGSFAEASIHGYSSSIVVPRSSPYNKSIDSIHTREQLEHLLSKDTSSHLDSSTTRNGSFTYFNVLDIGAPEERRGYQVSEQLKAADSKENIVVKMGPGSRVILSPASSEGDGQDEMTRLRYTLQHARHSPRKGSGILLRRSESIERRRRSMSMSSPERPLLSTGAGSLPVPSEIDAKSSSLREADLIRGEQRLRAWIVNTILEPLDKRIKETNTKLEKEHSSPPLKIGVSSVEVLQSSMASRPELLDTMLPYILPFLSVHSNQILNHAVFYSFIYNELQTVVDKVRDRGAMFPGRDAGALHAGSGCLLLPAAENSSATPRPCVSAQERRAAVPPLVCGRSQSILPVRRTCILLFSRGFFISWLRVKDILNTFLEVTVKSYLVGRISELAADKFMMDYNWNSGGREPIQEKVSIGRVVRRPWNDQFPTDAMLVFSLFSAYMDSQLTSNPLVGSCRLAQPFTALYTLKTPQRPNAVHLAAESFYLHMSNLSPPHFDFVFNDADGSPSRAAIPRGARNLFSAILSFIHHAKVNNGGRLDRMSIGPTGLNIACVLE
ncbi:hypothetical protein Y032_0008g211 [Ancylostoma ceylanicum]|uniref:Transmembrane protein 209 n=1 Tax=Ancylostoma ceylanicum TaxID=53326 RepID=A0A016VKL6_9BILA|nr:hypothetical protein Y032_0008g211 [Ancylostoma ceylanicum]